MIARLVGITCAKDEQSLTVLVQGVGFRVFAPAHTIAEVVVGVDVTLFTHLAVYDDRLDLFGFVRESELNFFKQLIKVRDVGPKSALAILSAGNMADIQQAIVNEDTALLVTVQGIGKKTAERIILELKEKIFAESPSEKSEHRGGHSAIISALVNLGYSQKEAREAVTDLPHSLSTDDERLRWVLQHIGR